MTRDVGAATDKAVSNRSGLYRIYHHLVQVPDKPCQLISNNVGPVKLFLNALLSFHLKELFSFAFVGFLSSCIDDHGSFVI